MLDTMRLEGSKTPIKHSMKNTCILIFLSLCITFCNAQKMTETEINQLDKISSFLDSISNRMVDDIKEIFDGDYGLLEKYTQDDIEYFEFELFEDGYRINFYPMDAEYNQLGFKKTLTEYPNGFLRDENLNIDVDSYDFDNEADMDRMDEFYLTLSKKFMDWFNKCWQEAGGLNLKDKYSISIHDTTEVFDLTQQKWVNNE